MSKFDSSQKIHKSLNNYNANPVDLENTYILQIVKYPSPTLWSLSETSPIPEYGYYMNIIIKNPSSNRHRNRPISSCPIGGGLKVISTIHMF